MTRQQIFTYAKTKYGTEPDYPWSDTNAVLRHRDNRKWYGLVMEVGREKLGISGDGLVDQCEMRPGPGKFPSDPGRISPGLPHE